MEERIRQLEKKIDIITNLLTMHNKELLNNITKTEDLYRKIDKLSDTFDKEFNKIHDELRSINNWI